MIITFRKHPCFYCQLLCVLLFVFCYRSQCDSFCNTEIQITTFSNSVNKSWQSSTWNNNTYDGCFGYNTTYVYTGDSNDDQGYQWIMFEFKQHILLDVVKVFSMTYDEVGTNNVEIWTSPEKVTADNSSEHCRSKFMITFKKNNWTYCGNTRVVSFSGSTVNCPKTATFTKMLLLRKFTKDYYISFRKIMLHGKFICRKAHSILTVKNNPTFENKSVTVTLSSEDGSPRPEHNCTLRGSDGDEILTGSSSDDTGSTNYIFTAHRKYSEIICHIRQENYSQFTENLNESLHIYYPSILGKMSDLVIDKLKVSFNVNTSAGNPPPEVTCDFNSGYYKFVSWKVESVFYFNLDFNNQKLVKFISGSITCKLTQKQVFDDQYWIEIFDLKTTELSTPAINNKLEGLYISIRINDIVYTVIFVVIFILLVFFYIKISHLTKHIKAFHQTKTYKIEKKLKQKESINVTSSSNKFRSVKYSKNKEKLSHNDNMVYAQEENNYKNIELNHCVGSGEQKQNVNVSGTTTLNRNNFLGMILNNMPQTIQNNVSESEQNFNVCNATTLSKTGYL